MVFLTVSQRGFLIINNNFSLIYLFYFFIFLICRSRVCSCLADDQLRCVFDVINTRRLKPCIKLIICSDLSYDDIAGIPAFEGNKVVDRCQRKPADP